MDPHLQDALGQAVMITAFVTVMMMAVEYLNVFSRGSLEGALRGSPALQYLAAALLGASPGCLGAFTVVALYSHRVVTVGALVATMIATSGDEAFVMLGLFPGKALLLMLGLALLGLAVAPVVDRFAGEGRYCRGSCGELTVHDEECACFSSHLLLPQWRRPPITRVLLAVGTVGYSVWIVRGGGGMPPQWNWVRVTLLLVGLLGVFVVSTVPDHFLREHLWRHVVARHMPRILKDRAEPPGEGPMDAEEGESSVVAGVAEVYPGLWISGMSVQAALGGPRMGPIFGGMLLSGRRAAALIDRALAGEPAGASSELTGQSEALAGETR